MRTNTKKDIYILSLDGGGIRGVVPVMVLQEMERILADSGAPRPVSSCFDLIAGTSTGGLIALALAAPYDRLTLDFEEEETEERQRNNNSIIDMYKLRFRANHLIPGQDDEASSEGPQKPRNGNSLTEMYKLRFRANRLIPEEQQEEEVEEIVEEVPEETVTADIETSPAEGTTPSLFSRFRNYFLSRIPDESRTPENEAVELSKILDIYERQGEKIFPKSSFRQLQNLSQMFGDKYDVSSLESLLDTIFSELRMREAVTPVVLTSFDCYGGEPYMISSYGNEDFSMKDAARATSAAPTYFSPLLTRASGESDPLCLIDGGICVNNPSLVAYLEAKKLYPEAERFHILSLGTASSRFSLSKDEVISGGMIGWMDPAKNFPLYQTMRTSQYGLTDYALKSLSDVSYHRIDGSLGEKQIRLDDAGEENIALLKELGEEVIENDRAKLQLFCDKLPVNN